MKVLGGLALIALGCVFMFMVECNQHSPNERWAYSAGSPASGRVHSGTELNDDR